jgi:hypothetical protein
MKELSQELITTSWFSRFSLIVTQCSRLVIRV